MQALQRARRLAVACGVIVCLLDGCYSGTAAYVPRHAHLGVDGSLAMRAIEDTVHAAGLTVIARNARRGSLVALSATTTLGDLATRERWVFGLRGDDVHVEMHPETRDAHAWVPTRLVCDCYQYAREREMLRAIRARLSARRAS